MTAKINASPNVKGNRIYLKYADDLNLPQVAEHSTTG